MLQGIKETVRKIFKNSKRKPFEMTDGQAEIFLRVIDPNIKWLWVSAPTRYGKTDIIAMAYLYLASYKKLKIPIVGGSEDKAKKIMEYIVQHLGDHHSLYDGLINIEDVHDVDRLKVTVSKDALRWRDGGWIYITSIDSRGIKSEGEGVVGEGGDIVHLEEAGLIKRKEQFSKVVRMPEEDKGWGKLVMGGNCIEGSVFEDAYKSPLYVKVHIKLKQAVDEGRFTQGYLDEKKLFTTSKDWKRYYEVEFPLANEFTFFKPKKMEYLPHDLIYFGSLDPNLGETAKGSLAGITVLGVDKKQQAYEVESIGLPLGPDNAMATVLSLPYKFKRFGIEAVQFQRYFQRQIDEKSKAMGLYIPIVAIEQKRKKEERIESMEPVINTGQILFKGQGELWDEMQDYPEADHLDVLDSLEMTWRLISATNFDYGFA